MAEHHGRGPTGGRDDNKNVTVSAFRCPPADHTFNLVIDKGAQDCVMYYSDPIERRMNMYREEVDRFLRLGDLEDEDG